MESIKTYHGVDLEQALMINTFIDKQLVEIDQEWGQSDSNNIAPPPRRKRIKIDECSQCEHRGTWGEQCTISTCPNFEKTKDCTMPKLLYFGQGSLQKSEALVAEDFIKRTTANVQKLRH